MILEQARMYYGSALNQKPSRLSKVKDRDIPLADGFLPRRLIVDGVVREEYSMSLRLSDIKDVLLGDRQVSAHFGPYPIQHVQVTHSHSDFLFC